MLDGDKAIVLVLSTNTVSAHATAAVAAGMCILDQARAAGLAVVIENEPVRVHDEPGVPIAHQGGVCERRAFTST